MEVLPRLFLLLRPQKITTAINSVAKEAIDAITGTTNLCFFFSHGADAQIFEFPSTLT